MEKKDNFKSELETQYNILIKAEEKEQLKRTIIIMVILILTLISTIITSIYSIKSYNKSMKDYEIIEDSKIFYNTLITKFNNTSSLVLSNITNGYYLQEPKYIYIANEGNNTITYSIIINSINTTLLSTNNLEYTITGNNTEITKELPLKDNTTLTTSTIEPGEVHEYTINIKFNGYMDDYAINQYSANIIIEQEDNKLTLLQ